MRTAKEMLDFARVKQGAAIAVYDRMKDNVYKLSFNEVEKALQPDEDVKYTFVASSSTSRSSSFLWFCSVAVTDKRIIIGGQIKGLLKVSYTAQSLSLKNVNAVTENYMVSGAELLIETSNDRIRFGMVSRESAGTTKNDLWNAIDLVKQEDNTPKTISSAADEVKKYKELLEIGAITQEEFDAKKKQLLGL